MTVAIALNMIKMSPLIGIVSWPANLTTQFKTTIKKEGNVFTNNHKYRLYTYTLTEMKMICTYQTEVFSYVAII